MAKFKPFKNSIGRCPRRHRHRAGAVGAHETRQSVSDNVITSRLRQVGVFPHHVKGHLFEQLEPLAELRRPQCFSREQFDFATFLVAADPSCEGSQPDPNFIGFSR